MSSLQDKLQIRLAELKSLPCFPFLPCPICFGDESCDHSTLERARAKHPGYQPLNVNVEPPKHG